MNILSSSSVNTTARCKAGLTMKAQFIFLDYRIPKLESLQLTIKANCVYLNQQICKQKREVELEFSKHHK